MNFCDGSIDIFWTHTLIQLNVSKGCNFTFKVKSFYAVDSFNSESSLQNSLPNHEKKKSVQDMTKFIL